MSREDLRARLAAAYEVNAMSPGAALALDQLTSVIYDTMKPHYIEPWLDAPAEAFGFRSVLQCCVEGDLSTPIYQLTHMWDGVELGS